MATFVVDKLLALDHGSFALQVAIKPERWDKIKDIVTKQEVVEAYNNAADSMARLNRTGAHLMHKHGAHGATDITGFGLLGHARNLAKCQKKAVNFRIHTLPVLNHMDKISSASASTGIDFKLRQGFSAETSGGLMVLLPKENAAAFCREIEEIDGVPAWCIGDVVAGGRTAEMCGDLKVIDVTL